VDKELEQFQIDLLISVRQMKSGEAVHETAIAVSLHASSLESLGEN
jgi:hypothetical protein